MVSTMNEKAIAILMRGQIPVQENQPNHVEAAPEPKHQRQQYHEQKDDYEEQQAQQHAVASAQQGEQQRHTQPIIAGPKVGRNDPCPCGSGKKYKNCHGKGL